VRDRRVDGGPVRIAQRVVSARGGNPQASVIGAGWKTSCDEAAFLNAWRSATSISTTTRRSVSRTIPASISRRRSRSRNAEPLGQGPAARLTVGYEVQVKVRDASEGGRRGFDLPSLEAQYSSAATAARLLGLDAPAIANAVAIAASFAKHALRSTQRGELSTRRARPKRWPRATARSPRCSRKAACSTADRR